MSTADVFLIKAPEAWPVPVVATLAMVLLAALDLLRTRMIVLASGSGRWEDIGESRAVADLLGSKGIPNRVDDWGTAYDHDWPTWWAMLPLYLDDLLP